MKKGPREAGSADWSQVPLLPGGHKLVNKKHRVAWVRNGVEGIEGPLERWETASGGGNPEAQGNGVAAKNKKGDRTLSTNLKTRSLVQGGGKVKK